MRITGRSSDCLCPCSYLCVLDCLYTSIYTRQLGKHVRTNVSLLHIRVLLYANILGATVTSGIFLGIHVGLIIHFYVLYVRISMSIQDSILIQVFWLVLWFEENWSLGALKISSHFLFESPFFCLVFFILSARFRNVWSVSSIGEHKDFINLASN